MKAKAAIFMGAGRDFEVREFDVVPAPAGYARMELAASGVCGTDLHFHRGTLSAPVPSIIGHEFVGRITDIDPEEGARAGLRTGDAVIADIAVPCGECLLCREGDDANCVRMQVTNGGDIGVSPYLYGGYAEVNFTPVSNLIRVPDGVDPVIAAVFACPGPTVLHAVRLAKEAGVDFAALRTAVVQGLGPVGVFAVMYLKSLGIGRVIAVTAHENPERADLARALGADEVLALERCPDAADKLAQENGGLGVDLCIEASGAPSAVPMGLGILRNRGVYLIPGQYSASGGVEIQPQLITFKALRILGSSQYSVSDVRGYLEFLRDNPGLHGTIAKIPKKYPISRINEAIADAKTPGNCKTLLVKG